MAITKAFTVLTEFKFETGAAVISSDRLSKSVGQISSAADEALFSLKRLGLGLVVNLGLGTTGLLGILGQALKISDNFQTNQLAFSQLISANMENLSGTINTFNDRLAVSAKIMKSIAADAGKFGLSEKRLLEFTKVTAALLIPKGLAGENFKGARDISRNLLKSAPSLGIDPGNVQGQLLRSIEGGASLGDTLFRRLVGETKAFEKFRGVAEAAKKFNALPIEQRFNLISKGLGQFAQDMEILNAQANTFHRLFQRIRDTFTGINSILKPLGDVIIGPTKNALKAFLNLLNTDVRNILERLAIIVKPLVADLERTVINLLQISKLQRDFGLASFGIILLQLVGFLRFIGVLKVGTLAIIGRGLLKVLALVTNLGFVFAFLGKVLGFVLGAVRVVILPFLVLLTIFQIISRAIAIARIADLKKLPAIMVGIMDAWNQLAAVLGIITDPILKLFNIIATAIAPIFQMFKAFEILRVILQFLADTVVIIFAGLQGIGFGVMQIFEDIGSFNLEGILDRSIMAANAGMEDFFNQIINRSRGLDGDQTTVSNITNIGKVEIRNDFKEKIEPDRVAFSLVEQLTKAAQNPTQSRGRSLRPIEGQ